MVLLDIDHNLAQMIQADRLKKAEHARLVRMAKTAQRYEPGQKWSLSFRLSRQAVPKTVAVGNG